MILGVGIDITDSARIKNMRLSENFIKKHFTEDEQKLINERKEYFYVTAANNFSVKEAFSKALGTGVRGFSLNEVEVLRNDLGKPYINLYGKAKEILDKMNGKNIFVSISDTDSSSAAVVIIEG